MGIQVGDIIEVPEISTKLAGLITQMKIVDDYGDEWSCQITDHYYSSCVGEWRCIDKKREMWKVKKGEKR